MQQTQTPGLVPLRRPVAPNRPVIVPKKK